MPRITPTVLHAFLPPFMQVWLWLPQCRECCYSERIGRLQRSESVLVSKLFNEEIEANSTPKVCSDPYPQSFRRLPPEHSPVHRLLQVDDDLVDLSSELRLGRTVADTECDGGLVVDAHVSGFVG
jgi:hypothetical protein